MTRSTIELRVSPEAFDDPEFPLGVVRIAPDYTVTYMNRAFADMFGELEVGQSVVSLGMDEDSRTTLLAELAERFEHQRGSGYSLRVTRADRGTKVHARVAAVPDYNADRSLLGSIGFIADESLDVVSTAIHRAMDRATTPEMLLSQMTAHLRDALAFDALMVTALGRDRLHLRILFESPQPPQSATYRWWPMPPFVQAMVRDFTPGPLALDEMFARPEYTELARTDQAMRQFIERDFHHALRLRVESLGAQVAIVTLLRHRGPAYTTADLRLCERLPVVEAVGWAMALDEKALQRFTLDLIDELTGLTDNAEAAQQRLVDALWERYRWEHVSLFRVQRHRGQLRMVCQARQAVKQLREGYEQRADRGLLGRALATRAAVNVPRVANDSAYESAGLGLNSELVLPLPGKETSWLLNIESAQESAFAEEERKTIEEVLRVAALVIERSTVIGMQSAIMDHMADLVIRTNEINTIMDVNRAGERMLGHSRDDVVGRQLTSFIELDDDEVAGDESNDWGEPVTIRASGDPDAMRDLLYSKSGTSGVLQLRRGDGGTARMLVSMSPLPGQDGGKIFVASDLSGQDYRERVASLAPRLRQVASEIRVPLALASSCLDEAEKDSEPADLVRKAMTQIRRADVSLERVMRLAAATEDGELLLSTIDLQAVFSGVEEELPPERRQFLHVLVRGDAVPVRAAFNELRHCLQSLLTRLLVLRSGAEKLEVKIGLVVGGQTFMALRLKDPGSSELRAVHDEELQRDVEPMVGALMRRMGGHFQGGAAVPRYRLVFKSAA